MCSGLSIIGTGHAALLEACQAGVDDFVAGLLCNINPHRYSSAGHCCKQDIACTCLVNMGYDAEEEGQESRLLAVLFLLCHRAELSE